VVAKDASVPPTTPCGVVTVATWRGPDNRLAGRSPAPGATDLPLGPRPVRLWRPPTVKKTTLSPLRVSLLQRRGAVCETVHFLPWASLLPGRWASRRLAGHPRVHISTCIANLHIFCRLRKKSSQMSAARRSNLSREVVGQSKTNLRETFGRLGITTVGSTADRPVSPIRAG
jgi:hypothetical protein